MIETRAPGKLFIVGEYAVVEAGEPAVLVAVDRYLRLKLTERKQAWPAATSAHVRAAIQIVNELRIARGLNERQFEIEIVSELDAADGRKFGLGSSAAVTVATIEALARLYELNLSQVERFKLALLATITITPRASGGDLAASTFGGWIRYTSPDRAALRAQHGRQGILSALESDAWSTLSVLPLPAPVELELLVGWTGSPASTEKLVESAVRTSTTTQDPQRNETFLAESRACVDMFADTLLSRSLGTSDRNVSNAVREARTLLQQLSEDRNVTIETPALRELCTIAEQHGAAAKPSGAGGGDCGIAFATPTSESTSILREWKQRGIVHLDLQVHEPSPDEEGAANER